jgi:hypothetical protein
VKGLKLSDKVYFSTCLVQFASHHSFDAKAQRALGDSALSEMIGGVALAFPQFLRR